MKKRRSMWISHISPCIYCVFMHLYHSTAVRNWCQLWSGMPLTDDHRFRPVYLWNVTCSVLSTREISTLTMYSAFVAKSTWLKVLCVLFCMDAETEHVVCVCAGVCVGECVRAWESEWERGSDLLQIHVYMYESMNTIFIKKNTGLYAPTQKSIHHHITHSHRQHN